MSEIESEKTENAKQNDNCGEKKKANSQKSKLKPKEDNLPKRDKLWSENEIKKLIVLRTESNDNFLKATSHETLWNAIAKDMAGIDSTQCKNKWKALKRKYIEVVDKKNKTGNGPVHWPWFDQFDKLYGAKDNTNPVIVKSQNGVLTSNVDENKKVTTSTKKKRCKEETATAAATATGTSDQEDEDKKDDNPEDGDQSFEEQIPGRVGRAKRSAVLEFLTTWTMDRKEEIAEREAQKEKRHESKMARLDRLIDKL